MNTPMNTPMNEMINGQCRCGEVTWQAELPASVVLNCHCNMCRVLSGADYSSWVVFKDESFTLLTGEQLLTSFKATDTFIKSFCRQCGSTITVVNNAKFPGHTYVARGNILTEVDFDINLQVFTDDKAKWVEVSKEIPVYNP